MTTIIHTDASTKNGVSVYCFKVVGEEKCHIGIRRTNNSAAMELLAIVRAVEYSITNNIKHILIVSDFLPATKMIKNKFKGVGYTKSKTNEIKRFKMQLKLVVEKHKDVQCLWVTSKNIDETHREVDAMAKSVCSMVKL